MHLGGFNAKGDPIFVIFLIKKNIYKKLNDFKKFHFKIKSFSKIKSAGP